MNSQPTHQINIPDIRERLTASGRYQKFIAAFTTLFAGIVVSRFPALQPMQGEIITIFGSIALLVLNRLNTTEKVEQARIAEEVSQLNQEQLKESMYAIVTNELGDALFNQGQTVTAAQVKRAIDKTPIVTGAVAQVVKK